MEAGFTLADHPGRPVVFTLNWTPPAAELLPPDLDIGCLYILRDGRRGVVQAAGGFHGSRDSAPHIWLPRDDPDGRFGHGEPLIMAAPAEVAFAVVFAMIYRGVTDFRAVAAALSITHPGLGHPPIELRSPDPGLRWCALAVCGSKDGQFLVVRQERYFLSARHADDHYGVGLDWGVGLKTTSLQHVAS